MNFNSFVIGMILCFLLSFCLGLERQFRRRFIGLRTMILVSIGSYIFVSFSFLVTGYTVDISRVASQVVAGIGFLGAGVIIKDNEKSKIRGLTTAATLWCDAGIGILCAGGFILEAIVATLIVLFSNIILRYVNNMVNAKVEEKNTDEVFNVSFKNVKNIDKLVVNFDDIVSEYKFLKILKYEVSDDNINLLVSVRKNVDSKLDKFIIKIVGDYKINSYSYEKVSETRIEDSFDEL